MTKIDQARPDDVFLVAARMRDRDFEEMSALSPARSRADLARFLLWKYGANPDVLCAYDGGEPVCIGGLMPVRPNVVGLMMFATPAFPRVGLAVTRYVKRYAMPRYAAAGVHRFEAQSLEGYDEVHDWLRVLGLEREAVHPGFGKNGEAFVTFAKVADAGSAGP